MTDDQFERLAQLIKGTDDKVDELGEALHKKIEALRAEMHEEFVQARAEIRDLRLHVETLEKDVARVAEQTASNAGFAKEIDLLRAELKAIEQRLDRAKIVA